MSNRKQRAIRAGRALQKHEEIDDDMEIGPIKIEHETSTDYESNDETEMPALKPRAQEHFVKKRTHKNQQQYEIFLIFMTKNPSIAKGFVKGDRVAYDGKWAMLADELNAVGPPTKDMQGWKKVWSDCKLAIKKKLANKMDAIANGINPCMLVSLTPAEKSIASVCGFDIMLNDVQSNQSFVMQPQNGVERLDFNSSNPEMEFNRKRSNPAVAEESSLESQPKKGNKRSKPENLEQICGAQNALMQSIVSSLDAIRSNVQKQTSLMAQHYKNLEEIETKKLEALQKLFK